MNVDMNAPAESISIFKLLWQIEQWFRQLVYVEFRADDANWDTRIKKQAEDSIKRSMDSDQKLPHMSTPHKNDLSFLTFGQLWDMIIARDSWQLFADYFPPKDIVEANMKEIKGIRNRVMHFREPHPNDFTRTQLFAATLDPGLCRFLRRYTSGGRTKEADLLSERLRTEWETRGYGVELLPADSLGWLYAPGVRRMSPIIGGSLEIVSRPASVGRKGWCYRLNIDSHRQSGLNCKDILEATTDIHGEFIHIILYGDSTGEMTFVLPDHNGVEKNAELCFRVLDVARNAVSHATDSDVAERFAEHVLGCRHPIAKAHFVDEINSAMQIE